MSMMLRFSSGSLTPRSAFRTVSELIICNPPYEEATGPDGRASTALNRRAEFDRNRHQGRLAPWRRQDGREPLGARRSSDPPVDRRLDWGEKSETRRGRDAATIGP